MNTRGLNRNPIFIFLIACAIIPLLLSACQPVSASISLPPAQATDIVIPEQPTATPVQPTTAPADPTAVPAEPTQPPASTSPEITLDLSGLARDKTVETVAAVQPGTDTFWTGIMPEYTLVTLQGYPISDSEIKPQIFVYPAAELAKFNEAAGKVDTDLQALLQSKQAVDPMPYLPLINAKQVIHPQVQYVDFKSGKGVRFVTWFSQGMVRINNAELTYTYQGLTSDGKYYIAAVLPVTHLELPATPDVFAQTEAELKGYPDYITKTAAFLDEQTSGSFSPDLAKLDALVQSIEVK